MAVGTAAVVRFSALKYAPWNALLRDNLDKGSVRWTFGLLKAGWTLFHGLVTGYDLFTISAIHTGYSYDNIGPFTAHEQSPS